MKESPVLIKIDDLLNFYIKLKKYTNVDESIKRKHIENIQKSRNLENKL